MSEITFNLFIYCRLNFTVYGKMFNINYDFKVRVTQRNSAIDVSAFSDKARLVPFPWLRRNIATAQQTMGDCGLYTRVASTSYTPTQADHSLCPVRRCSLCPCKPEQDAAGCCKLASLVCCCGRWPWRAAAQSVFE